MSDLSPEAQRMYDLIPENGNIGNVTLRKAFGDDANYTTVRQELINAQFIQTGRGKGGSVHRFVANVPADTNAAAGF
jgi:hypothetical protein